MSQNPGDAAGPVKRKATTDLPKPPKRLKPTPGAGPAPAPAIIVPAPARAPAPAPPALTASVLPAGVSPAVAGYVGGRAARIAGATKVAPTGTGSAAAHFTELRKRYDSHPRVDRPRGGATGNDGGPKKLPDNAGEKTAAAVAGTYKMLGLNTFKGKWMATGRASVPVPMVGRRDLQLLSQLCQLFLNAQHEQAEADAKVRRAQARQEAAKAKAAAGAKSKKGEAEATVKAAPISAQKSQEIEAMVLGDRILISANETWATDFLATADLRAMLRQRQSPSAAAPAGWEQRKERKIADVVAALLLPAATDPQDPALPAAAKSGLARLVQVETDCETVAGQRDAVKTILQVLYNIASGNKRIVRGGSPAAAAAFVTAAQYAGCIIVVDATMSNGAKKQPLLHSEQSILLTALLAGYAAPSSVAGGKRPCTVCWLTLRLARNCGHDVNFNWHPGGYWDGSTFRGLARVAQQLGFRTPDALNTEILEICKADGGLVQYVTTMTPDADRTTTHQDVPNLGDAVMAQLFSTDTLTQSFSQEYHSPGSFSDDAFDEAPDELVDERSGTGSDDGDETLGGTDDAFDDETGEAMPGVLSSSLPDADELGTPWRDDDSESEFPHEGGASGIDDEGDALFDTEIMEGAFAFELSILPDLPGAPPIPKEPIPLAAEGTNMFGSDGGNEAVLPGAPEFAFTATVQPDGVWIHVMHESVTATAAADGRPLAIPEAEGRLLQVGDEIHVGVYTLQVVPA